MIQDIPEALHASFFEEIKHFLGYARYKYVLSKGANVLDLEHVLFNRRTNSSSPGKNLYHPTSLLSNSLLNWWESSTKSEQKERCSSRGRSAVAAVVEDMLSAIDTLTGNILTGEITIGHYQPISSYKRSICCVKVHPGRSAGVSQKLFLVSASLTFLERNV